MTEFNLPVFPLGTTFAILSLAMLVRYFSLVGLAFWITRKLNEKDSARWMIEKGEVNLVHIRHDIFWSVLSSFIFALSGTLLIRLWQMRIIDIYLDMSRYGWWYFIMSGPLLFFLHDCYFYWTHRLLHRPSMFKHVHRVHHESKVPSAWTAFSFHPWEAVLQALILPALLFLFPIHWSVLIFFLSSMTMLGIINHLGSEFYPPFLLKRAPFSYLISASHHQLHHKKVIKNFGLYFTFWDLLMKTEFQKGKHVH